MDTTILLAFGVAILSVILGFIALLSQRIYIDPKTQEPTDIKIPILGRMKTNYPSLVFVFLGFSLMFFTIYHLCYTRTADWNISGRFVSDEPISSWGKGTLALHPCNIVYTVNDTTGDFTIEVEIEEGTQFEDHFDRIHYTHDLGQAYIIPKDELENHRQNKPSLIESLTPLTRIYRSKKVKPIPN